MKHGSAMTNPQNNLEGLVVWLGLRSRVWLARTKKPTSTRKSSRLAGNCGAWIENTRKTSEGQSPRGHFFLHFITRRGVCDWNAPLLCFILSLPIFEWAFCTKITRLKILYLCNITYWLSIWGVLYYWCQGEREPHEVSTHRDADGTRKKNVKKPLTNY
jgi:hypothetical protein